MRELFAAILRGRPVSILVRAMSPAEVNKLVRVMSAPMPA